MAAGGMEARIETRALIVDGSLTVRMRLVDVLAAAGFETVACGSAEEARRALARTDAPTALLIVGRWLPDAAGAEFVAALRAAGGPGADVPVLLLDGDGAEQARMAERDDAADPIGADNGRPMEVLRHPWDPEAVVARARVLSGVAPEEEEEEEDVPEDRDPVPVARIRPVRILIVDDSPTYREQLREQLARDGYQSVVAASGEEALARLASDDVDCICLDLVMPGMDGREACRRIRTHPEWRSIPIVMLTARDDRAAVIEGLHAGADDFVAKSGETEVLKARIRAQLRRRSFEEENQRIRDELLRARMEASIESARAQADREQFQARAALLADLAAKNAELRQARDRAEEAVRVREDFMRVASHELKTPLTSLLLEVQSMQHLVTREQPVNVARLRTKLDLATRQTERLSVLVDNLLDVSRISAGRLELRRERFDLLEVTRDVAQRLTESARMTGSTLALSGTPAEGFWDRLRCEQIITNLIANAIKYGNDNPIEITVQAVDGSARLTVRDHGIGISLADRDRIFGRFERASSAQQYGGLGLGLYITRRLTEAHGGSIVVTSEPGRGSCFVVELPMAQPDESAANPGSPPSPGNPTSH